MPIRRAIAAAVSGWSPVIMIGVMPAARQAAPTRDVVDRALGEGQHPVPLGGVALGGPVGPLQERGIGRVEQLAERLEGALDGDPDMLVLRVQRGHPPALGVERQLLDPWADRDKVRGAAQPRSGRR
jgi:hypothetical protein